MTKLTEVIQSVAVEYTDVGCRPQTMELLSRRLVPHKKEILDDPEKFINLIKHFRVEDQVHLLSHNNADSFLAAGLAGPKKAVWVAFILSLSEANIIALCDRYDFVRGFLDAKDYENFQKVFNRFSPEQQFSIVNKFVVLLDREASGLLTEIIKQLLSVSHLEAVIKKHKVCPKLFPWLMSNKLQLILDSMLLLKDEPKNLLKMVTFQPSLLKQGLESTQKEVWVEFILALPPNDIIALYNSYNFMKFFLDKRDHENFRRVFSHFSPEQQFSIVNQLVTELSRDTGPFFTDMIMREVLPPIPLDTLIENHSRCPRLFYSLIEYQPAGFQAFMLSLKDQPENLLRTLRLVIEQFISFHSDNLLKILEHLEVEQLIAVLSLKNGSGKPVFDSLSSFSKLANALSQPKFQPALPHFFSELEKSGFDIFSVMLDSMGAKEFQKFLDRLQPAHRKALLTTVFQNDKKNGTIFHRTVRSDKMGLFRILGDVISIFLNETNEAFAVSALVAKDEHGKMFIDYLKRSDLDHFFVLQPRIKALMEQAVLARDTASSAATDVRTGASAFFLIRFLSTPGGVRALKILSLALITIAVVLAASILLLQFGHLSSGQFLFNAAHTLLDWMGASVVAPAVSAGALALASGALFLTAHKIESSFEKKELTP